MANKVYEIVTKRVLDIMAQGIVPWCNPWKGTGLTFMNISGREYSGINRFMLSLSQFPTPLFMTFHQAQKLGGSVKKGATAFPIFFYSYMEKEDTNGEKKSFPIFRYSNAFNIDECEDIKIPKKIQEKLDALQEKAKAHHPIEEAQAILDNMQKKPVVHIGLSDRAFYSPKLDSVTLPKMEQFETPEEFYSTAFHELGHSTGHTSRLNRDTVMDNKFFGSHEYSVEELIAEFTATFLAAESGIERSTIENSAAYLQSWSRVLKEKPAMLVQAASKAQKAADYILGKQSEETTD